MPTEFRMPKLGLTMEEGTIVEWLVPDGGAVTDGSPVLVIETDKVETEVNVIGSGRLQHVAGVGDTLACGEVVGLLLVGDEAGTSTAPTADVTSTAAMPHEPPATATASPSAAAAGVNGAAGDGGRRLVSPNARRVAAALGVDVGRVTGTGPGGRVVAEDVEAFAATSPAAPEAPEQTVVASARPGEPSRPTGDDGTLATFAARSLADLLGVDIRAVATDARDGRATRDDVARHVRGLLASKTAPAPAAAQVPTTVVPLRGMRGTIAKRMHQSLQEMAQLTLTMDAELDAVVADRERRRAGGVAPGFTDYVIAAAARALRDHPHVNAQITPDGVAHLPGIHVGVAVAVPGGLVVPVVRDADRRPLADLAGETSRLAAAARDGGLTLADLEGGTFSVTALGMYGVDAFTPVINPPNVAILGVGRLRQELALVASGLTTVHRATLSLTWDHRAFDGVPAAEFTRSVVGALAAVRYDN